MEDTWNTEMDELVKQYRDSLFASAFSVCRNASDAEDVVQDTFLTFYLRRAKFESEEHKKAWLLRVAINKAKNVRRTFWWRNRVSYEEYMESMTFETPESAELFEDVMKLPEKYRIVIHLFYYEDYSVKEIAQILNVSEGSVKMRLSRGRAMLRVKLEGATI
ncbi:MAG: sigma-70 family RNA polymerase sigma factor [Lachnospiraceae bacterium]|jgi:RNA polymerase sigma-70 factor (ECF subfamily)|nr:sigma-70 family RNA polymerase sigma factor [Lachnospiraceae bacterium]